MSFYIQAGNSMIQCISDNNDKSLADAIESIFPLYTESAVLMWNQISIPLSYKYDISYMMEDILLLLSMLQSREKGQLTIRWLPDTFRCDWTISWDTEELNIHSRWENTVGNLEKLLNERPNISLKKDDFIREWKSILGIVISGLKKCGYDVTQIKGMKQLIEQYKGIIGNGIQVLISLICQRSRSMYKCRLTYDEWKCITSKKRIGKQVDVPAIKDILDY